MSSGRRRSGQTSGPTPVGSAAVERRPAARGGPTAPSRPAAAAHPLRHASASRAASASSNRNDGWSRGRSRASRSAVRRIGSSGIEVDGPCVGAAGVRGEQRLEIAIGHERVDVVAVPTGEGVGHRVAVVEVARHAPQRPVDEHPDGALGPAEDAGDLRGRHLVDEAQDERPAAILGQPRDRPPRCSRGIVAFGVALAGRPARRRSPRPRAGPPGGGGARRRRFGDDVAGDLEEPDAEGGRALAVGRAGALLEPRQVRQRRQEDPLGGVLGVVVVAQFVEREAVHLGQVLPIEGVEVGRVRLGRLDEPPVAVEVRQGADRPPTRHGRDLPECRVGPSRYTRDRGGFGQPRRGRSRREDDAGPWSWSRGSATRPPGHRVDAGRADASRCRAPSRRGPARPVVTWRARPCRRRRNARPGGHRCAARGTPRRRSAGRLVRCGARPARGARSSWPRGPSESRPRPSRR